MLSRRLAKNDDQIGRYGERKLRESVLLKCLDGEDVYDLIWETKLFSIKNIFKEIKAFLNEKYI